MQVVELNKQYRIRFAKPIMCPKTIHWAFFAKTAPVKTVLFYSLLYIYTSLHTRPMGLIGTGIGLIWHRKSKRNLPIEF